MYTGGWPNEFLVCLKIKEGEENVIGFEYYVYFVFVILLTIFGVIYQIKFRKKEQYFQRIKRRLFLKFNTIHKYSVHLNEWEELEDEELRFV